MLDGSLERRLGLPHGLISTVLTRGIETQYIRFRAAPKTRLIRRPHRAPKKRSILAPTKELKSVQRSIAQLVEGKFNAHEIAHGYVSGKSIFTNARMHVNARLMLRIDLVDFFGSINRQSIIDALRPLLDEFTDQDINTMADLCCYDDHLPEGSPASPVLSNLVCYPLDEQLDALARRHGCKVSRYSDDMAFSTTATAFPAAIARICKWGSAHTIKLETPICSLLKRHGFSVNASKLNFQSRPTPLSLTGLSITDSVSVSRQFWDNLRAGLHQWERLGLEVSASAHSKGCIVAFVSSMRSSIAYVRQAHGPNSDRYRRVFAIFEQLWSRDRDILSVATQKLAEARKAKDANVSIRRIG
jgi:RNA-directed DNA polymerase